ncbi:hypothetical protein JAAARDRAFT_46506 [Jaapia argillacea MUCL 33604]|uniref:Protein kinase domain-containing protein n=1 Tax=Jaapia argillacea MUCL 33604 TaxID=933084 RepID=A0A067PYS2_9AGAM|nr:hypothetical protein JAAARDRAFT_46506 [Jaapia argillacea MUCL 33604]
MNFLATWTSVFSRPSVPPPSPPPPVLKIYIGTSPHHHTISIVQRTILSLVLLLPALPPDLHSVIKAYLSGNLLEHYPPPSQIDGVKLVAQTGLASWKESIPIFSVPRFRTTVLRAIAKISERPRAPSSFEQEVGNPPLLSSIVPIPASLGNDPLVAHLSPTSFNSSLTSNSDPFHFDVGVQSDSSQSSFSVGASPWVCGMGLSGNRHPHFDPQQAEAELLALPPQPDSDAISHFFPPFELPTPLPSDTDESVECRYPPLEADGEVGLEDEDLPEDSPKVLTHGEITYTIYGFLGEGGFGRVMHAHTNEGEHVAIKVFHKAMEKPGHSLVDIAREELEIMTTITEWLRDEEELDGDAFLMKLFAAFDDEDNIYFVMPLYPTTLTSLLSSYRPLSLSDIKLLSAELLLGLSHLHSLNILHFDIKPTNVLVSSSGHIVLCDFGCGRMFKMAGGVGRFRVLGRNGTRGYMPPEILQRRMANSGVDIWGWGLVLFEMFTGQPYFKADSEDAMDLLVTQATMEDLESRGVWDKDAAKLLRKVLHTDPRKRWSIDRIMKHHFFEGLDWKLVSERRYEPTVKPTFGGSRPTGLALRFSTFHDILNYKSGDQEDALKMLELGGEKKLDGKGEVKFDFTCPAQRRWDALEEELVWG